MKNSILVTGGSGFVGRSVATELAMDHAVLCTYRRQPEDDTRSESLIIDLANASSYEPYTSQLSTVTTLVHTASYVPEKGHAVNTIWEDYDICLTKNITILRNLLGSLPNLRRAIFVSSCYVELDDPSIGFYGVGKQVVELALHRAAKLRKFHSIALRFPQIYGPDETHGVYPNKFVQLAVAGSPIVLDPKATSRRDLVYIKDVVKSVCQFLAVDGHETITISSETPYSALEVADQVIKVLGGGTLAEPAHFNKPQHSLHFKSNYDKYGFKLEYSLERGLAETIQYYKGKRDV